MNQLTTSRIARITFVALGLWSVGVRLLPAAHASDWQPPREVVAFDRAAAIASARRDLEEASAFAALSAQDLGEWKAVEAVGELGRWARGEREGEKMVRIAALRALGSIGGEAARSTLEQVVADEAAGDVRVYAAQALELVGDAGSVEALRRARATAPNMITVDAIDAALKAVTGRDVA